jgi:exonuclease III
MYDYGIGVLALQETKRTRATYGRTAEGFLLANSGGTADREFAGVGFLVAPWCVKSIMGLCLATPRMASIKLKIRGGSMSIISAYAPHGGYSFDERTAFYDELAEFWGKRKAHGPRIIAGDLNARLHRQFPGEEEIVGPSTYGNPVVAADAQSNRSLLLSMCLANNLQIASTFGHRPVTERVTYYCQTAKATDPITPDKFSQLDHYLVETRWATKVTNCKSHVLAALSSHHFLMTANVEVVAHKASPSPGHCVRRDWGHLREMAHANQFRQQIAARMAHTSESDFATKSVDRQWELLRTAG